MIEGLSTLAMTGTTVVGVFKTLGDESLSMEEKLGQVLTTLLVMLPMIVSSFSSILSIGPGAAVAINAITVAIGVKTSLNVPVLKSKKKFALNNKNRDSNVPNKIILIIRF